MPADAVEEDDRVSQLAPLAEWRPDAPRAEQIRARCHGVLARRHRRRGLLLWAAGWRPVEQVLAPAAASLLALVYLRDAFALAIDVLFR